MNFVYVLDIIKTLEVWSEKLKGWIMDNYGNPLLWVGILGFGILLLKVVFGTIDKDNK